MSAPERTSSAKQSNEWAARANERMEHGGADSPVLHWFHAYAFCSRCSPLSQHMIRTRWKMPGTKLFISIPWIFCSSYPSSAPMSLDMSLEFRLRVSAMWSWQLLLQSYHSKQQGFEPKSAIYQQKWLTFIWIVTTNGSQFHHLKKNFHFCQRSAYQNFFQCSKLLATTLFCKHWFLFAFMPYI